MLPLGANYGAYRCATPMSTKALSSNGSFFRKRRPKEGPFPATTTTDSSSSLNLTPATASSQTPALSDVSSVASGSRPSTAFPPDHAARRRRDSSISSLSELKGHFRRRSANINISGEPPLPAGNLARAQSPDAQTASTTALRPALVVSTLSNQPSSESVTHLDHTAQRHPASAGDLRPPRTLALGHGFKSEDSLPRPPSAPPSATNTAAYGSRALSQGSAFLNNPRFILQHIRDVTSKRISTLDYLRKAHEGRVYWFNALRFTKDDLYKMPYFDQRRLGRRASNYLLLGVSIPAILDPNNHIPYDYLRAFNSLLNEFESYQAVHPSDGTASTSLSRTRIPQMFKRAAQSSASKGRRGSAADTLSTQHPSDPGDTRSSSGPQSASSASPYSAFPTSDQELLPGEEYSFLQTPSLPFDPDYFETFATLCEILIDCYVHIMTLVHSPEVATAGIGDLFSRVDAKVRKILVAGLVRDFEDASKQGIKGELAGVGKVVLGGLM